MPNARLSFAGGHESYAKGAAGRGIHVAGEMLGSGIERPCVLFAECRPALFAMQPSAAAHRLYR